MSAEAVIHPWRSVRLVGHGVFIELLRRKDLYVLTVFMLLFLLGVGVISLIGIDNNATATFLLNLGMTLSYVSAHVLTLLLAARQMPDEIENRTLYPLLAKPLERHHLLAGKWLASTLSGTFVYLVLFLLAWGFTPKREAYETACLVQMLVLQPVSLGMMASLAICFSLWLPRAMNVVVLAGLFTLGNSVVGVINRQFDGPAGRVVEWFTAYLPNFSKLNLTVRYSDGIAAVPLHEFLGLIAYGILVAGCAFLLAAWTFERRDV